MKTAKMGNLIKLNSIIILIIMGIIVITSCVEFALPDTTKPTVYIITPIDGDTLSNLTTISINIEDASEILKVDIFIDRHLIATIEEEPWDYDWQSSRYSDGLIHNINVEATDVAENIGVSETISVIIPEIFSGDLVLLTGGTFEMGDGWNAGYDDEIPLHQVTLSSFEMSTTEITNQQYLDYINESLLLNETIIYEDQITGLWKDNYYTFLELDDLDSKFIQIDGELSVLSGYDNFPVVNVSWFGATSFAEYYGYGLPTEAQWEFAARGISSDADDKWSGTSLEEELSNYSWYSESSNGYINEVATKLPNINGLYDMSGNAWEWCNDWHDGYSAEHQNNPQGPEYGFHRILRGGCYLNSQYALRCSNRGLENPNFTYIFNSFRIVRSANNHQY